MNQALRLAQQAADQGEVPVGALVVTERGQIIGKGYNQTERLGDVTAHAEMLALTAATQTLGGYDRYTQWHLMEVIRSRGWKAAKAEAWSFAGNGFLPAWVWRSRVAALSPGLTAAWLKRKARQAHDWLGEIDHQFRERNDGAGFISKPLVERLSDILYADTMLGPLQELLRYSDRNAMAHGMETRFPFLDHQLVEFIFSLPSNIKFRNGFSKWILRENYRSRIPSIS